MNAPLSPIRLWQMVKKEFKQLLRDPKAKPLLLVSPIVQFLLLSCASTTDVEHIGTVIVDQDRSADSRALVQAYEAAGYFDIVARGERPEDVSAALDRGDAVLGVIIPPGFTSDLRDGRGQVQALIDGSDASVATVAQSYVEQVTARFGGKVSTETQAQAGRGVELRARAWYNPSLQSRLFNVPAIMGTLVLMTCMMLTTLSVVREREIGTLDQLQVSPMTAGEIMLGKMAPIFTVAVFHMLIFLALSLAGFGVPFRGTVGALTLAALLFILAGLALGLLISTVSQTQQEAFMLLILCMLPTIVLSGMLSPVESMPAGLQWITLVNPVRHFLDIIRGVMLRGTGIAALWPQFAALTTIVATALGLATYRFRHSIA